MKLKRTTFFLFISLFVCSLVLATEYRIRLDENGITKRASGTLPEYFKKGDVLVFETSYLPEKYKFTLNVNITDIKPGTFSSSMGTFVDTFNNNSGNFKPIILNSNGKIYKIVLTRYLKEYYDSREKGVKIYEKQFKTYLRQYHGLHLGVLFPFYKLDDYEIGYELPSGEIPGYYRIVESSSWKPSMIIYASLYPFGLEPGNKRFLTFRRLQLDIGTELSGSIFDKVYIGVGYNLTLVSFNIFACMGEFGKLRNHYKTWEPISENLKSVPMEPAFKIKWGLSICLPFDFAITWIGKVMGVK